MTATVEVAARALEGGGDPTLHLPFVVRRKGGMKFWVPQKSDQSDDYAIQCDIGREWAACYVRYLRAGGWKYLGDIARNID
ncbi:MAG TPA: hypothetical protein VH040_10680, partial [Usitatibacter sp.]|nr:hypothetical protein [Usitatibacter sp.]